MVSSQEIRQQYIDFFVKKHGHTFVPSSSVVPHGDETLLFANAGMNQFKPYFLGTEKPKYTRVANTQKCIRAGGKHNDLDDVGKDTYHHTFFEMLGNWSFGDYFKKEAITWAWELLTDVWKLDPTRLHVTVFEGDEKNNIPRDDEAASYWQAVGVLPGHIHLGNKKDNFWEMGSTGPCGPCTEVHIDRTQDKSGAKLVNAGTDQVIEIWNNVFIQFNRNEDQSLTPLPAQHVDTGMGFERICSVIQGVPSNYDTDVFLPILQAISKLNGATYTKSLTDRNDIGFRVIADHLRMSTFAIVDGARPGNKKRDAVLRSVIRRAIRYGYLCFDQREPFLYQLVPVLIEQMGTAFPELKTHSNTAMDVLKSEEKDFFRTIVRGLKLFNSVSDSVQSSTIPGATAADLATTYGFPVDLTQQMALERGQSVDMAGYDVAIEEHKKISGQGRTTFVVSAIQGELPSTDDQPKYAATPITAKVLGWVQNNQVFTTGKVPVGERVALLFDQTNFYAEQGGQVGDRGSATASGIDFSIEDTQRLGETVLHLGQLIEGDVTPGQELLLTIDATNRQEIQKNHTTTHLLNLVLRNVLGPNVDQKGSLVDADKTRFDFSHDKPITPAEMEAIQLQVNQAIQADLPVVAQTMPLDEAKKLPGVRAVFGEKYPDPVRVVVIGTTNIAAANASMSIEFCGGTHLATTGSASLMKIVSQEAVAKGVRRITAVTGNSGIQLLQDLAMKAEETANKLKCRPEELSDRVDAIQEEVKKLQGQLKAVAIEQLNYAGDALLQAAEKIAGTTLLIGRLPAAPFDALKSQIDRLKTKAGSAFIVILSEEDGKVSLIVALSADLVAKKLNASELIKTIAAELGGKGGGNRPDFAQAGAKDPSKIPAAIEMAKELAKSTLQ